MTNEQKIELFEKKPIPRAVASLAAPTIISSLVMVLYNLADTYFVGALGDPVESAAVTLAAPVLLAFNAVINLFGVGSGSLISRALGKKDYETVKRTSAMGFYGSLFLSVLFSVITLCIKPSLLSLLGADSETYSATAGYMFYTVTLGAAPSILNVVLANMIRSEGESMPASIGTISGCIINVFIDPLFIMPWGLGMGAAGAGLATLISNCIACAYFFIFLYARKSRTYLSISIKKLCFKKEIIFGIMEVGIPAAVQNILNVTGMTVLNNFTSSFGTDAVAAMGITHKVNMIPMYFSMGLGQGIMPLVGYNYASGNHQRMKKSIFFTAKISVCFIAAASAVYYFASEFIISLFMKDANVVAYGADFLKGFCLGLPFLCIDFLAVGIFQAVGMGKESFIFALLRKLALEIPALIILNLIWPLYGLAYSQLCAEAVLAVAAVIVLRRFFKKCDKTV